MPEKLPKEAWEIDSDRLAKRILAAAEKAATEEDLKIAVEKLLKDVLRQIGIETDMVRYEKATGLRGRMDAVYGFLIIDYKAPGKLRTEAQVQDTQKQIAGYLEAEAQKQGANAEGFLQKAIGVGLDGERIMFVRYSQRGSLFVTPVPLAGHQGQLFQEQGDTRRFQAIGPVPVSAASIANFLIFARATVRRPLAAEHLAEVFGPSGAVARQAVSELYSAVERGQRQSGARVGAFYKEWERIFGVVYGERLDAAESAAAKTASMYGIPGGINLKNLLFAIHTYYAFLMKLIAIELLSMQESASVASFVGQATAANEEDLQRQLTVLESGASFKNHGIVNFLEADFFSWYLDTFKGSLSRALRGVIQALDRFEPATPILHPDWGRDLLQKLYELVVPKDLRHNLGEYYTPDWLAEYTVENSGYNGNPDQRYLDPACGSGTFLVQALRKANQWADEHPKQDQKEIGQKIVQNIVGFDLNPLAVLAARTNYLIGFARFLPVVRPLSLPVFLCDSVVTPSKYVAAPGTLPFADDDTLTFQTTKGDFTFPNAMRSQQHIASFAELVDKGLGATWTDEQFGAQLAQKTKLAKSQLQSAVAAWSRINELHQRGEDGIWANYIKNAFAPAYVEPFDYVVGNPPWIRWGFLSAEYRERTLELWHQYGLFSLKGHATRLGGGEKDFSMLFTYAAADLYLKNGGTLAFVITMEVFKSKGAGEGFRRFQIGTGGPALKVLSLDDMVHLQPFQAANKTAVFVAQKGHKTRYPVPTLEWKRKPRVGKIAPESTLDEVKKITIRYKKLSQPVDPNRPGSSWQTSSKEQSAVIEQMAGGNFYKAFRGASTEPYGVIWLDLVAVRPDGMIVVKNQFDRGKRKVKQVEVGIESKLVFPSISGGEIRRFGMDGFFYTLLPHDPIKRQGFDEDWLRTELPHTYGYLSDFKSVLTSRAAYKKYFFRDIKEKGKVVAREPFAPFYSMYNISEATFAPWRVAWKRMAAKMAATVLHDVKTPFGNKRVIGTDTTSLFVAASRTEAHYLCAILNAPLVDSFIKSYSSGGRGFGAPSVMNTLAIPKFNANDSSHAALAELSEAAHKLVAKGQALNEIDKQLDQAVNALWNIKP